jgi:hypothetical protein
MRPDKTRGPRTSSVIPISAEKERRAQLRDKFLIGATGIAKRLRR